MGSSKSTQSQTQNSNSSQSTTFANMSDAEKQALSKYTSLGDFQLSELQRMLAPGMSPYTLSSADQKAVADSFAGAKGRFMTQGKDYADYLATTRGLNKSDTPVSQQAMERFGMGLADLESQQAQAGLNYGLIGSQLRLGATGALPAGLGAAFAPVYNERMASGITRGSGNSSGVTSMVHTPSLMSQIGQGMSLGSQAIGLGAQIGGLAMGMPMPGMGMAGKGMGSGAAANSWFA